MARECPPVWALVPVRQLGDAKSRLSPVLSPTARATLQRGMLADVLAVLAHARAVAGTAVVSADPEVATIGRTYGTYIIDEGQPAGLNAAVAGATEALANRGIPCIIVLPADVPLACSAEIDQAVELARSIDARVVVPDRRADGTNAFVFNTADPPAFAYGPGSLQRHLGDARRRPARLLALSSLALDVDLPSDLSAFIKSVGLDRAPHTRAALAEFSAAFEELP